MFPQEPEFTSVGSEECDICGGEETLLPGFAVGYPDAGMEEAMAFGGCCSGDMAEGFVAVGMGRPLQNQRLAVGIMDPVFASSGSDWNVTDPFFKRPLIWECKIAAVKLVDGLNKGRIGPVIDGHHRCLAGLSGEVLVTGEVSATKPVDALFWVANNEEGDVVSVIEDR